MIIADCSLLFRTETIRLYDISVKNLSPEKLVQVINFLLIHLIHMVAILNIQRLPLIIMLAESDLS